MSLFYSTGDIFYSADSLRDEWYEAAIVLYEGIPPATDTHTIVDVHVVRGDLIASVRTENFTIPADGTYFVAFYAGSYDASSGGESVGASMEVGEVSVSSPPP
jgi:hypothetical protein